MLSVYTRIVGPGSPFELIERVIDGEPLREFKHGPHTLIDLYRRLERANRCTLIVNGSHRHTYGDVMSRSAVLSHALVNQMGVHVGMRIGIVMGNCPDWLAVFIAITSLGATAVLVHHEVSPERLTDSMGAAHCTILIADSLTVRKLTHRRDKPPFLLVDVTEIVDPVHDFARIPIGERSSFDPEQEAVIAFTSGTSGSPKGVVLTHRCIMSGLTNMLLGGTLSASRSAKRGQSHKEAVRPKAPTSLLLAPFSYVAGYSHFLLMAYAGGTIVTMPEWSAQVSLELIAREGIRSLAGATPTMLKEMLSIPNSHEVLSCLTSVGVYGAALDSQLLGELTSFLPATALTTGYGMTETSGSVCVASGQDVIDRPGTAGPILPSVDLKCVRDDSDEPDQLGGTGEIWLRGSMIMKGYCEQPDLTRRVFQGRWFRTGDLGRVDSDGFLYVVDRVNDVISCNGERISCAQIERVLMEDYVTEQASVFSIPDVRYGHRLIVAIVPSRQHAFDGEIVRKRLAQIHATAAAVCKFMVFERLPNTASGKIDRMELRRLALHSSSPASQ